MSEDFPAGLEAYGTVPDPPVDLDAFLADDLEVADVTQHVVALEDGAALCGAGVEDDAPVYPLRGRRDLILEGMQHRCEDCVEALRVDEEAPADA